MATDTVIRMVGMRIALAATIIVMIAIVVTAVVTGAGADTADAITDMIAATTAGMATDIAGNQFSRISN
jgi:hypothetical protein